MASLPANKLCVTTSCALAANSRNIAISISIGKFVPTTTSTFSKSTEANIAALNGLPPKRSANTTIPSVSSCNSAIAFLKLFSRASIGSLSKNGTTRYAACFPAIISNACPTPTANCPCPVRINPIIPFPPKYLIS